MNRETARVAVLAACCIVAIALASATLPTPTKVDDAGDGDSAGGSDQFGFSTEDRGDGLFPSSDRRANSGSPGLPFQFCQPALLRLDVLGAILGGLLVSGGLLTQVYDRQVGTVVVVAGLVVVGLVGLLFLAACDPSATDTPQSPAGSPSVGDGETSESGSGSGDGETVVPSVSLPTIAVVVLVGLGLFGVVIAGLTLTRSNDGGTEPIETPPAADSEPTIGAVAGTAADDLEDDTAIGLDNAIYRAWADMTEQLSVEQPETSTPAEFERAAVDAGLDPAAVAELTDLFETVRYGQTAPTDRREQQAIDVLRRIESTAPSDEDTGDEGDGS